MGTSVPRACLLTTIAAALVLFGAAHSHAQYQGARPAPAASPPTASQLPGPKIVQGKGAPALGEGFEYAGGAVLAAAGAAIGQPVSIVHREKWLIAGGRYALWDNGLEFKVRGRSPEASDSAAEALRTILARPGCVYFTDAKGAKLPAHSTLARTKSVIKVEWAAIPISDKSQAPKTLHLPWGRITLIDRVDLPIPSSPGEIAGC